MAEDFIKQCINTSTMDQKQQMPWQPKSVYASQSSIHTGTMFSKCMSDSKLLDVVMGAMSSTGVDALCFIKS